jgi:DNA-binding transcriptional regulator YbjK
VADSIIEARLRPPRDLVLTQELYSLAAREPAYRDITSAWMARSQHALQQHFDASTSRLINALIEGFTIYLALDIQPPDHAVVFAALDRVTRSEHEAEPGD